MVGNMTHVYINGQMFELICSCIACPEQYDVLLNGKQVGYIRLRHGHLRVDCPDCMDETVFKGEPKGDGMFDDDERAYWMDLCLSAISKYVDDHPELLDKLKNYDILRNL